MKVIINCAMSADGKIALRTRRQTAISNEEDLRRVHELRNSNDGILVGVGTVLADDPKLTVKHEYVASPKNPVRIVLDSNGRTPPGARVLDGSARTIVVTSEDCSKAFANSEVVRCGAGRVDLPRLIPILEDMGIRSILVEGGSEVIWSFLRTGLADEMFLFVGSMVIGGEDSPTPAGGEGAGGIDEVVPLRLMDAEGVGNGILLRYEVVR